jgi:hypothetical protein
MSPFCRRSWACTPTGRGPPPEEHPLSKTPHKTLRHACHPQLRPSQGASKRSQRDTRPSIIRVQTKYHLSITQISPGTLRACSPEVPLWKPRAVNATLGALTAIPLLTHIIDSVAPEPRTSALGGHTLHPSDCLGGRRL